jgi:hypothetical protein
MRWATVETGVEDDCVFTPMKIKMLPSAMEYGMTGINVSPLWSVVRKDAGIATRLVR